ncbi:apolipoprotein C-III [Agelaius tricolor]
MLQGPVRVPGRGHRALGTHRGQPPAQPRAQRSRGRVSLRAKGTAGRAGTGRAGAVPRSEEPRGARGRCARGQGRWMSPLCRACPGCPLRGQRAGSHTRVPTLGCMHTRTDTRGPSSSVPRHFPTLGWTQRPCSPPAPCPDLCTNPPGGRGEAIKREPGAAPASEPGTAMKASLLFLLACTAVLALGARADTSEEPKALVQKVQELAQKVSAMTKDAFSRVRESEAAQQARQWLSDNAELAKQRLAWLKEQLAELLKKTPAS